MHTGKKRGTAMKGLTLMAAAALLLAAALPAAAADFLVGARPLGMGSAYTAMAGDVNCVPWNPAGLATVNTLQFTSMYADLYELNFLKESNFALAVPLGRDRGVAGIGYSSLSIDYDYPSYFNLNTLTWRDSEFRLSYARPLNSTVNLGATFNWASTVSNVQGGQMQGYSFDLGVTGQVMPQLTLGAAFTDLLARRSWDSGTDEKPGTGYRFGAQYLVGVGNGLRTLLDLYGNTKSDDTLDGMALGFEYPLYYRSAASQEQGRLDPYFSDMQGQADESAYNLTLRAGMNHAFQGDNKNRLTLGGSFGMGMAAVDYAFVYDKDNLGNTHVVSLGLDFGRPSWHRQVTQTQPDPVRNVPAAAPAAPAPAPRSAPAPYTPPPQPYTPPAPAPAPAPSAPIYVPPLPPATAAAPQTGTVKVAILPFGNNSRNERLYWLSEGMVDILGKEMAPYPNIQVIPKATMQRAAEGLGLRFTGDNVTSQDIRTLGMLLGADQVVVGSFAEGTGTTLNLYARIYDTASGQIKGYENVSNDVINIFTMARDLATRIRTTVTR